MFLLEFVIKLFLLCFSFQDALRLYLVNSPVVRAESLRYKRIGVFGVVSFFLQYVMLHHTKMFMQPVCIQIISVIIFSNYMVSV